MRPPAEIRHWEKAQGRGRVPVVALTAEGGACSGGDPIAQSLFCQKSDTTARPPLHGAAFRKSLTNSGRVVEALAQGLDVDGLADAIERFGNDLLGASKAHARWVDAGLDVAKQSGRNLEVKKYF
jgi:hypothetical protein